MRCRIDEGGTPMRGPRIGVTTKRLQGRDPLGRPQMGTEAAYLRAVWAAGGLPVMFPESPRRRRPLRASKAWRACC
jgi:hypothetical protein